MSTSIVPTFRESDVQTRRLLHCGAFSDLFIADLARMTRERSGILSSAFGLEVLKGDRLNPWPGTFQSVKTAEQIAPRPSKSTRSTWREERQRDDASLLAAGFESHFDRFDLYHFHTLFVKGLWQLELIPRDAPLLLSIWGSDLLRVAGEYEYGRQLAAIERADLITVQSLELREILLAKFGRKFKPKVRLTTFGTARLPMLHDRPTDASLLAFRRRFGILDAKHTIVIGHAATPFDQHIAIVRALKALPATLRDESAFVLPMGYGGSTEYVDEVRDALRSSGLNGVILREMLDDADIVHLRYASDVFIYMPESDALSGSLQEAAYAGNLVITGAWLPYYSRLRRAGVMLPDVESIDDLPNLLECVLESPEAFQSDPAVARAAIEELCDWGHAIDGWLAAYEELLQHPRGESHE